LCRLEIELLFEAKQLKAFLIAEVSIRNWNGAGGRLALLTPASGLGIACDPPRLTADFLPPYFIMRGKSESPDARTKVVRMRRWAAKGEFCCMQNLPGFGAADSGKQIKPVADPSPSKQRRVSLGCRKQAESPFEVLYRG
jgi:hypothetical protein